MFSSREISPQQLEDSLTVLVGKRIKQASPTHGGGILFNFGKKYLDVWMGMKVHQYSLYVWGDWKYWNSSRNAYVRKSGISYKDFCTLRITKIRYSSEDNKLVLTLSNMMKLFVYGPHLVGFITRVPDKKGRIVTKRRVMPSDDGKSFVFLESRIRKYGLLSRILAKIDFWRTELS